MSFYKYHSFDELNDSCNDWCIRVRAQAIWKGVNNKTKDFKGFNVIFFDDSNRRIHAFISAQLCEKIGSTLKEGQIYEIRNFAVKTYNGDETHRAIRNDKHIYFTQDTKFIKDSEAGLQIMPECFDLFKLSDVEKLKKDNRYLIDVVGVIEGTPSKIDYKKDQVDQLYVKFTITDGSCSVNVTFFNDFGKSFLNHYRCVRELPVIIIIASANINEWNDEVSLTNYPATRFYLNHSHSAVHKLRTRAKEPNFYVVELEEDDDVKEFPKVTVKELLNLKEDYVQKHVQAQVTLRKVEQNMNWYYKVCTACDIELPFENKQNQCEKCKKFHPYPDKRFRLFTLCSDSTGTVPVVLPNEEVIQLIGMTVYDILADENEVGDGDKFPRIIANLQKKQFDITILISEENIKQGSQVYNASKISKPLEISATNSPKKQTSIDINPTAAVADSDASKTSPPTGNSTNKSRARKNNEPLQCEIPKITKHDKESDASKKSPPAEKGSTKNLAPNASGKVEFELPKFNKHDKV